MPIRAIFTAGVNELTVSGLTQWDYGQKLEIHGLALPALIEVHFACLEMTEAIPRIGTTVDGVTTVAIPDGCLEHDTPLRAWVYVVDTTSGKTERTIHLPIVKRTKPQGAESRQPFEGDEYAEAIQTINETVDGWRDGIVDQNDGGKTKVWTGTRAQFNELEETDDHTLYVITDELPDYTELVESYEQVRDAIYQQGLELRNLSGELYEQSKAMENIQDGTTIVPQAGKAHYDAKGRNLTMYGYLGEAFQLITQLTDEGVYQFVAELNGDLRDQYYFSLVCWGGMDTSHNWTRDFAGPHGMSLQVYNDGSFGVYDADGSPVSDCTIYARKISPFSGWAVG